ncbi:HipA family kinase [Fulvivirga sediminis]|uniref:Aminotransferase class I and II n=1 Tax=Fulvivirga sediminis TaxID=2803949 RepID=A0A937K024_9BACT|nr:HipA family kinase [Fulvivirga sediminis]MBL3655856.1 aminotransferase class I and II [Fulvivirga sediminis]
MIPEDNPLNLRLVNTTRYVTPLREGGSMPAIVEADDDFLYVLKFRGAGQGTKALISELIGGEIARKLGFHVPEIVFVDLQDGFGKMEGDEEIQDLLNNSVGTNLGLHYLSNSITFDPVATEIDTRLASQVVWLDALLMNVDRTVRNTNMLWWNNELWLIDHGASLYFHHAWNNYEGTQPFSLIKNHVLLSKATELNEVNDVFQPLITPDFIDLLVDSIPDDWLKDEHVFDTKDEHRNAYKTFLKARIANSQLFIKEADHARLSLI